MNTGIGNIPKEHLINLMTQEAKGAQRTRFIKAEGRLEEAEGLVSKRTLKSLKDSLKRQKKLIKKIMPTIIEEDEA